ARTTVLLVSHRTGHAAGKTRRPTGHALPDDPENPRFTRPAPRVRDRAPHRGDQPEPPRTQLWHALSRAPQARTGRGNQGRVEPVGEQPPREVLRVDGNGPETAGPRNARMACHGGPDRRVSRAT